MLRRVKAGPTRFAATVPSGRTPCRKALRRPRLNSCVVIVAVLARRSRASVSCASVVMANPSRTRTRRPCRTRCGRSMRVVARPPTDYAPPHDREEQPVTLIRTTRRGLLGGLAATAALGTARAQAPALPPSPVALNVVDVAGQLQLVQQAMEEYRRTHSKLVSRFAFSQAPAPELPGKLRAQQSAGRVDIDLVLTGTDALAAGIEQNLWEPLVTNHAASLPKLDDLYQPAAAAMQQLAQGQAVCTVFCPAGPLLEYMPDRVKQPPTDTDELLAWAKAHPKRFLYARPANSGPGRTWLQGLPYLLGDKDPKDPKDGWDKTW